MDKQDEALAEFSIGTNQLPASATRGQHGGIKNRKS